MLNKVNKCFNESQHLSTLEQIFCACAVGHSEVFLRFTATYFRFQQGNPLLQFVHRKRVQILFEQQGQRIIGISRQIFVFIHESTCLLQRNVDRPRFAVNKERKLGGSQISLGDINGRI